MFYNDEGFLDELSSVKSLFTDTFTLLSTLLINPEIIDRKTEFLDAFPMASLESFPLDRGFTGLEDALTDIACGLLTDNIPLNTSISTTNSWSAAR